MSAMDAFLDNLGAFLLATPTTSFFCWQPSRINDPLQEMTVMFICKAQFKGLSRNCFLITTQIRLLSTCSSESLRNGSYMPLVRLGLLWRTEPLDHATSRLVSHGIACRKMLSKVK